MITNTLQMMIFATMKMMRQNHLQNLQKKITAVPSALKDLQVEPLALRINERTLEKNLIHANTAVKHL